MTRTTKSILAIAAFSLAACTSDPVSPAAAGKIPAAPVFAASVVNAGDYVVGLKNAHSAASVSAQVAALGGTVRYMNADAGLALVSGLSDASATTLGRNNGVGEMRADAEVTLAKPVADVKSTLDDVSIQSVGEPATAVLYDWQWNMRLIGANTAWAAGHLGNSAVTVAIIDSGIDYDIADMNGLVDLSRSVSFVPSDDALVATYFPTRSVISDFNGHGTNVATQVSSKAVALAGVTSKTTLIAVKVIGWTGSGSTGGVLAGVLWAADHGANIANMSLGGAFEKAGAKGFGSLINKVFNYANKKGMLIVVAAGNDGANLNANGNEYSAYCDSRHVICVSSVGPATAMLNQDAPAFYTNFGSAITVAAPGGNADAANGFPASPRPWGNDIASWIWSYCSKTTLAGLTAGGVPVLAGCQGGNRVTGYIGTSQASPHVAGEAASILGDNLGMNSSQLRNAIEKSADKIGANGQSKIYGSGRINVAKAHGL